MTKSWPKLVRGQGIQGQGKKLDKTQENWKAGINGDIKNKRKKRRVANRGKRQGEGLVGKTATHESLGVTGRGK